MLNDDASVQLNALFKACRSFNRNDECAIKACIIEMQFIFDLYPNFLYYPDSDFELSVVSQYHHQTNTKFLTDFEDQCGPFNHKPGNKPKPEIVCCGQEPNFFRYNSRRPVECCNSVGKIFSVNSQCCQESGSFVKNSGRIVQVDGGIRDIGFCLTEKSDAISSRSMPQGANNDTTENLLVKDTTIPENSKSVAKTPVEFMDILKDSIENPNKDDFSVILKSALDEINQPEAQMAEYFGFDHQDYNPEKDIDYSHFLTEYEK